MKAIILGSIILLGTIDSVYAVDNEEMLHASAHIGASWVITHLVATGCKNLTKANDTGCLVLGGLVAGTAGAIKEATDGSGDNHIKGFTYNGLGIAGAVLTLKWGF